MSASVFVNRTKEGDRPFREATLDGRYQDGEELAKFNSFLPDEIAAVMAALQMALQYIQERISA